MSEQKKEKGVSQVVADLLAEPVHKFIKWGEKSKPRAVLVVVVLAAVAGTAGFYLGEDNAISTTIEQEQAEAKASADPSNTQVVPPATIEP